MLSVTPIEGCGTCAAGATKHDCMISQIIWSCRGALAPRICAVSVETRVRILANSKTCCIWQGDGEHSSDPDVQQTAFCTQVVPSNEKHDDRTCCLPTFPEDRQSDALAVAQTSCNCKITRVIMMIPVPPRPGCVRERHANACFTYFSRGSGLVSGRVSVMVVHRGGACCCAQAASRDRSRPGVPQMQAACARCTHGACQSALARLASACDEDLNSSYEV